MNNLTTHLHKVSASLHTLQYQCYMVGVVVSELQLVSRVSVLDACKVRQYALYKVAKASIPLA